MSLVETQTTQIYASISDFKQKRNTAHNSFSNLFKGNCWGLGDIHVFK